MSKADRFVLGDYNAACFECGAKKKASELVKHWQGYFVCPSHNEQRHPQDFAGKVPSEQPVPRVQHKSEEFIAPFPEPPPFIPTSGNT